MEVNGYTIEPNADLSGANLQRVNLQRAWLEGAVELALGNFNQTLDPAIAGVSGADDVNNNQENDLLGTDFQDAPTPLI